MPHSLAACLPVYSFLVKQLILCRLSASQTHTLAHTPTYRRKFRTQFLASQRRAFKYPKWGLNLTGFDCSEEAFQLGKFNARTIKSTFGTCFAPFIRMYISHIAQQFSQFSHLVIEKFQIYVEKLPQLMSIAVSKLLLLFLLQSSSCKSPRKSVCVYMCVQYYINLHFPSPKQLRKIVLSAASAEKTYLVINAKC